MNGQITHLIINFINIEDNVILVGATDNERWKSDTEEGMSGTDAKTIVYVTLTDNSEGYSTSEDAGFHCSPGDPTRFVAMSNLIELFNVAWVIKNEKLNIQDAREWYFSKEIKKAYNNM